MTVKDHVKQIVEVKFSTLDVDETHVNLVIDEIETVILNYCNILEVPHALRFTLANMTVDLVKYEIEANRTDELDTMFDARDVSIIHVGDTEIDFRGLGNTVKNRILKSHDAALDDIVMNYQQQLNRFRKMVW